MNMTLKEYLREVKSQLTCNASDKYKETHVTYEFSNETIDNEVAFFDEMLNRGYSAYMALLYFGTYWYKKSDEEKHEFIVALQIYD